MFLSRLRQHRRFASESGVAAIELAIALPVLMLILFGIINFGTVFYDYIVITNAAREGARWGAINANTFLPPTSLTICSSSIVGTANPCEVANSSASNLMINYGGSAVPISTASFDDIAEPELMTVTVTFNFEGTGSFFKSLFGNLSATSRMYIEQ